MIKRQITAELKKLIKEYPVVTVVGPRQAGKTTLVTETLPKKPYINLEEPDIRNAALADPRGFLSQFPKGAILDEIQNSPELLSYIQAIVDRQKQNGQFILTGSHQLQLHQAISQSLAGRTALLTLLPLSISELSAASIELTLNKYLLQGFLPKIHAAKTNAFKTYRNYLKTYIERDLRQLIHVKELSQFQRFLMLCAGRIGQLLNINSLANDVGVSAKTIDNWLSVLEASYVIFRLQPYFENFGKRVIKSSKLYFSEPGLATYLLGIENETQLIRDPLRGQLVENLVILELIKDRLNHGLDPRLYYFRDNHGNEVDVIYQHAHQLVPVEIKSSQTFTTSFLKGLDYFKNLVGERCQKGFIIYDGKIEQNIHSFELINFKNSASIFDKL